MADFGAGVAGLVRVWENFNAHQVYRADPAGIGVSGARWLSALALGWAFKLPTDVVLSLAPKSVTAPVAMGIADKIGGIPALAAVFAVVTGMVGALSGKYLFDALKIGTGSSGWMVRGFSLGTAAHGIGAAV